MTETNKRQHRATFSRDKKKGGYLIRVEGPHCARFAGREVPVTKKDNSESLETLDALIWTGTDHETGKPIALYTLKEKERKAAPEAVF